MALPIPIWDVRVLSVLPLFAVMWIVMFGAGADIGAYDANHGDLQTISESRSEFDRVEMEVSDCDPIVSGSTLIQTCEAFMGPLMTWLMEAADMGYWFGLERPYLEGVAFNVSQGIGFSIIIGYAYFIYRSAGRVFG